MEPPNPLRLAADESERGSVEIGRRWLFGVGMVSSAALAGGALCWWTGTPVVLQSMLRRTPAEVTSPEEAPSPDPPAHPDEAGELSSEAGEARLLYSTRTWRSYDSRVEGIVEIYRLPGGRRILRLAGITASAGPAAVVRLSPLPYTDERFGRGSVNTGGTGSVSLGRLRSHGSTDLTIPDGTDLGRFASVVIWRHLTGRDRALAAAPVRL